MEKFLTISKAKEGLKKKEFTSVELLDYYLDRIEKHSELNAYVTIDREKAQNEAKAADARIQAGEDLPLLGIPIGVKDLFCTKGLKQPHVRKCFRNSFLNMNPQ